LSTLKKRRNLADTIAFIKNPKAPMPALYPSLISEQNVTDVATYVLQELARYEGLTDSLSRVWSLCYYSPRMNFTARSYRFAYFYWPNQIGGRRTALG
jgi:hypothetical protein